jgi:regulator of chromosome condensation (RCC1) repeat-containing protein/Regulator of Chromosome Condensation (RCC1) repeat protein
MAPRLLLLTPFLLLSLACGDGGGPGSLDARIDAVPPNQFSGTPLAMIEGSLIARVTDADNQPLAGVDVVWSTDDGSVSAITDKSDEDGQVFASWTLGWRPGLQHARATAVGVETPAVFEASVEGFRAQGLSTGDGSHQCGIDLTGVLFCWGGNADGELGDGSTTDSYKPIRVLLPQTVLQVVTGDLGQFTCALTSAGEVYCWGSNTFGQLGNGTTASSPTPTRVLLPGSVKSLTAIGPGVCAVAVAGDAYCWGSNAYGRFGTGTDEVAMATPTRVLGGLVWRHLALGDDRACGVTEGGQAYCWGRDYVELGTGVDTNTVSPLPVVNAPPMDSLTLSGWHQCGLTAGNVTYCWGTNHNIGVVDTRDIIPEPMALTTAPAFASIHSVFNPTFALGIDGRGYWWGPPHDATGGRPEAPVPFSGDIRLRTIGTSHSGVCGIEENTGTVYCWSAFSWDGPEAITGVPVP